MLIEASYTRARDRPRFQPHVFLSFGKSTIPAKDDKKNKCQNSRLVLTKCSLVCQANNTSQGQTLFFK